MDKERLKELLVHAEEGEKDAREELIQMNLGLVGSIVKRYENRGHDREELFQIGVIGLINAVDKFNLNYNVEFSTYAVPMIRGEIQRFLRDDGLVRVSRGIKENGLKIKKTIDLFRQRTGREPSIKELSAESGLNQEEIIIAYGANSQIQSIFQSVYEIDGDEILLLDRVVAGGGIGKVVSGGGAEEGGGNQDYEKEQVLNRMTVEQMLESLSESEQDLVRLRYFEEMTQVQTATRLGMTQVQVSRKEKKILLKLRNKFCRDY